LRAAPEAIVRGIISWIVFFSAGVLCAGSYFYRLHPEHSPESDLPRLRQELESAYEKAERLKRAWQDRSKQPETPAPRAEHAAPSSEGEAEPPAEHAGVQR